MHHQSLTASLAKAESTFEKWEKEAKDGATSVVPAEIERDEAKQEAKAAQLVATAAGDVKARVEVNLTKALNYLAAAEEGGGRSEAEVARLEVEFARVEAERESLLLELEASKCEVSSLHARASKDRKDMVEDYQGSLDLIFSYGYGCCAFKKKICRDRSDIMDGMPNSPNPFPPEFFDNLRCPPAPATVEAIDVELDQGGAAGDFEGGVVAKE